MTSQVLISLQSPQNNNTDQLTSTTAYQLQIRPVNNNPITQLDFSSPPLLSSMFRHSLRQLASRFNVSHITPPRCPPRISTNIHTWQGYGVQQHPLQFSMPPMLTQWSPPPPRCSPFSTSSRPPPSVAPAQQRNPPPLVPTSAELTQQAKLRQVDEANDKIVLFLNQYESHLAWGAVLTGILMVTTVSYDMVAEMSDMV